MVGMTKVHFDTTKANRMGISYKCDLNQGQIDIQTIQTFVGEDTIEHVEKVSNFRIFPNALIFYHLTETDQQHTFLSLKFHYSRIAFGNRFFGFCIRRRMKLFLGKSVLNLKKLSENMHQEHFQ